MDRSPFILFFCTILIISTVLLGCTSAKNDKISESADTWQGVITLWDFPRWPDKNGNRFCWIEQKINEFEKAHPGVFIHLRHLKWEYGLIELRAAAASGIYPDIAPIAADFDFIAGGFLEPLDKYFKSADLQRYEPKAIEAVTYQGRIYGFPWFMTTYGLYLNKEIFNERNATIPEKGSWSYDEFVSALQKVTYDKNNDGKIDYYGFNLFLSPGNYQVWGFLTIDGAQIFDEKGNFTLNTPEGVSALTKLVDLEAKYKVVPSEEYGTLEEKNVWSNFIEKKKIAVYPAGPWAIKILTERQKSGVGFEYDIAHYPKGESIPSVFALVSGYAIFKQEDQQKKDICAEFLKYITSESEQVELESYGVFSVYTEIMEKSINNPMMTRMKDILDTSVNLPKVKNWHKIDEVVTAQIRQALLSKKTPLQALEDAEIAVKTIMSTDNGNFSE